MARRSALFIDALDIEDVMAHLLVAEGFNTLEDIAYVPLNELSEIEGFDEELATELQNRAKNYLEVKNKEDKSRYKELGVTAELAATEGLTPSMLVALGEAGVKTKDDFADLASDELLEIVGSENMTKGKADKLIMKARESWFAEEDAKAASAAATEKEESPADA